MLVLRNPLDRDVAKTSGTAMEYLFTGVKGNIAADSKPVRPRPAPKPVVAEAPPPKKEAPFVMEIISGNKKNETKFEASGEGK